MADHFDDAISALRRQLHDTAHARLDGWLREATEPLVPARFRSLWEAWTPLGPDQREQLVAHAIGALAGGAPLADLKFRQLQQLPE